MKRSSQKGSAHAIVIVLLIVALLGALGFVFYQNFIQKPVETTSVQSDKDAQPSEVKNQRVAFESKIYTLDYPTDWTAANEVRDDGSSSAILQNSDKTIRINFSVSRGAPGGTCDTTSQRKVRFYNVSNKAVTKLNGSDAYIVEAMTDAIDGGYDYSIGLTQDGGDTHAAIDEPYCTVMFVGVASRLVLSGNTVVHPTIMAKIDFPKLAAGTDKRVKEMQQIKDMFMTDDYKEAIKILESARRE